MARHVVILIPQLVYDQWQKYSTTPIGEFLSEAFDHPDPEVAAGTKWHRVGVTIHTDADLNEIGLCRYARTALLNEMLTHGKEE